MKLLKSLALLFFFTIISCKSDSNKENDPQLKQISLTEIELNDARWIKIDTLDCYLFEQSINSDEIKKNYTVKWDGDCFKGKANGYGKALFYKNGEFSSEFLGCQWD